jgi:Uncharacterized small protein
MNSGAWVAANERVASVARVLRRIIGVPDYDVYVAHMRTCHPDFKPMSEEAFARDALVRRHERPGNRCC